MHNIKMEKKQNNVDQLIEELDKKGFESLITVLNENPDGANLLGKALNNEGGAKTPNEKEALDKLQSGLMSIMSNGSKEFKKKTGRRMTYSEMREAWG